MLNLLFTDPISFLFFLVAIIIAITIHEFAHAFTADRLGDPTPRLAGRLTLNPIAHLDPIGTLALIVARFGWGKPVPVDPYNLKNPRKDHALISFSGPASNLILAGILGIIVKFLPIPIPFYFVYLLIVINISLALFNLLPVPPLDGASILVWLLPKNLSFEFEQNIKQYGTVLLIFIVFPLFGGRSIASIVISPVIELILQVLLP
jgi:Zn-dependent protease